MGLELTDPGFDFSVLSEFRSRLIDGSHERQLLDLMLSCFVEKGLLKSPKQQRTDSSDILASIRVLSRLENIGETLRYALNTVFCCCTKLAANNSSQTRMVRTLWKKI